MNIEELKRLAEAATPGPWVLDELLADFYGFEVRTATDEKVCADASNEDAAYIAAANPAAVLELIRQLEHHKADSEVNIRLLAEARKNDVHCMAWLADCRIAVDDNGKRMLPEFVEYLKALKQQRDELLAALKNARELVEDWGAYAPAYMQEKHDLQGDLDKLDAAIANAEKQS